MKKLMVLALSFGLVLLGTAPVMAAGQTFAPVPGASPVAGAPSISDPSKIDTSDLSTINILEPPGFVTLGDEALQEVNGQGLIGAIAGGLLGMVGGALVYAVDAAVGAATGHCTANAHDFAATVAKSTATGAAAGAILSEP